nr:2-polyprenyl-3-methyl-6-methoxy-1,4-benzoquinone monooxygenase [Lysobacter alkalisoli]
MRRKLPPMQTRRLTPLDRFLDDTQRALETVLGAPAAERPNPAGDTPEVALEEAERRHAAGLMRINHVGEVCAQALYSGQAAVARDPATRTHLLEAAQEETDHLAWCADRLRELDDRPSLLNPLWYAGSFTIGAVAGLRGDGWNLGFVVETERQVEAHIDEHLDELPAADARSRAILEVMKADEARHADNAEAAGARVLPPPIPSLMALASKLMKTVAYRI